MKQALLILALCDGPVATKTRFRVRQSSGAALHPSGKTISNESLSVAGSPTKTVRSACLDVVHPRGREPLAFAFEKDHTIIEAQQRIWNLTAPAVPKAFLPQDKGPFMMHSTIERLMREERDAAE